MKSPAYRVTGIQEAKNDTVQIRLDTLNRTAAEDFLMPKFTIPVKREDYLKSDKLKVGVIIELDYTIKVVDKEDSE